METAGRWALLMSGGIGDYLHYLTRLEGWMQTERVESDQLTIFVESTAPHGVESLFNSAFPKLRFKYAPAAIHWTKTNPLLVPDREIDRINRPAHRFVAKHGFQSITDWFLPFCCNKYQYDESPLTRVVNASPKAGRYLVIAARDKGFLWWPSEELCRRLEALVPPSMQIVYLGTANERHDYMRDFVNATNVAEALAISYHASLFIGTDTGTATIRELTGRKNIYCVSQYWVEELMAPYGYWTDMLCQRSGSVLTCSADELVIAAATELFNLSN